MLKNNPLLKSPRSISSTRGALALMLLLSAVLLAACGDIAVEESVPTYTPQGPPAATPVSSGPLHDLGIMGVDFDPHLDIDRIMNRESVNVIVGVMNLGNSRENEVQVNASLWDADQRLVLARAEDIVSSVAAGDVVAARLTTTDTPPVYSEYKLVVEIVPVSEEIDTTNNRRMLDISVHTSNQ